ncbi:Bombyxin B-9 like protein [Argiope bruennichi]|uniref:Bombyxin B-9 like protein n=1 Tax=Argiope bruennichi TaxID=94029 RepID=A0A8T0ELD9_ARGBR|nr:Bombyxin B-9 like protein [Argiope bruennichi]
MFHPKFAVLVVLLLCVGYAVGDTKGTVRACGRSLSELLSFVCHGNYNEPSGTKRSDHELIFDDKIVRPVEYILDRQLRVQRGVADECCHRPCSFSTLRSYCGSGKR